MKETMTRNKAKMLQIQLMVMSTLFVKVTLLTSRVRILIWVVDSGASHHVTTYCDYFSSYTTIHFGHAKIRNYAECKISIEDVCLDKGYHNYFKEGKWKLTKGSLVITRGKKYNSLYRMETNFYGGEVNIVDDSSTKL